MAGRCARRPVGPSDLQVTCLILIVFTCAAILIYWQLTTINITLEVKSSPDISMYSRNSSVIFIGGFPGSGVTMMRTMLDAHPLVRSGQETWTGTITRLLSIMEDMSHPVEVNRLNEAGVTQQLLDRVVSTFILTVAVGHGGGGESTPWLCIKSPILMRHAVYLGRLFPRAKFLLMVRDGRAAVHSAITRNVTLGTFNTSDLRGCLRKWNNIVAAMYDQCHKVGGDRCMPVYYEKLVQHPEEWMRQVLSFLGLPWDENVLHHEQHINEPGGVRLSSGELLGQLSKPVNTASLGQWGGFYSSDVLREMSKIAPMLGALGYDPNANPPDYDTQEAPVLEDIRMDQEEKKKREKKQLRFQFKDFQKS